MAKPKGLLKVLVILAAVFVTLVVFQLPGTSSASTPSSSTSSSPLLIAAPVGMQIDTLNPFTTGVQLSITITGLVYPSLLLTSKDLKSFEPYIAQSWNINTSNGTAIFHLNPNAKWSDGTPITAKDVVYSFTNYMASWSSFSSDFSTVTSITAPDNSTVVMHISGIMFDFLVLEGDYPIVPYHVWKDVNATTYNGFTNGTSFVGGGPFLIQSYTPKVSMTLVKNSNFWLQNLTAKVNKVVLENFASSGTEFSALQSGDVDSGAITLTEVSDVQNSSNLHMVSNPGTMDIYLSFNMNPNGTGNPALQNLDFREGLMYALNMSYIVQAGYRGYATLGVSTVNPTNPFLDPYLSPWPYNVSKANKLLNDSGYKWGTNGYRENPNGTTLTLNFVTSSGLPTEDTLLPLYVNFWKAVGVKVTTNIYDAGTLVPMCDHYTYDLLMWDWHCAINYPSSLDIFLSKYIGSIDHSGFNSSTYDTVYNEMVTASSLQQAMKYSFELQNMTYSQLPYASLYFPNDLEAYNNSWTGINASIPSAAGIFGTTWNFVTAQPASQTTTTTNTNNWILYVGAIIAVIVVVGAIAGLTYRKRKKEDE